MPLVNQSSSRQTKSGLDCRRACKTRILEVYDEEKLSGPASRFDAQTLRRPDWPILLFAALGSLLAISGCGGSRGSFLLPPISVLLPITTVVVSQGGSPVVIPIEIGSTSETALVSVNGLPAGIQVTYAASDTNPSGTLTFTASDTAPPGTYSPIVSINSASQMISTGFTLIVNAK